MGILELDILKSLDGGKIISAILTAAISALGYFLRPLPRVVWGVSHTFRFTVTRQVPNPFSLDTRAIFVRNQDRAVARGLEIHFTSEPINYHVWPTFPFRSEKNPEGQFILRIEQLGKREHVVVEMIGAANTLPLVTRVRTEDGECKQVPVALMPILPG